jgi:hypothetical protein
VPFAKYLKAAFLNPWNLLAFSGGLAVASLAFPPLPGVLLPLVAAGEITYLALLGSHRKFQKYVEAQQAKSARQQGAQTAEQSVQQLVQALPAKFLQRFEALRTRCLELQQIGRAIKDSSPAGEPPPLEELQVAGLDRLLWIYLRLLFTQHALERFLGTTSEQEIQRDIQNLEGRLQSLSDKAEDSKQVKIRKALEDNLETCRARLANFQKACDNHELIQLEIDRLEKKIRSLSELAVNRQEPDFISGQVNQVAASMVQTERTMSELHFLTGLEKSDEAVPEILQRETSQAKH